MDDEIDMNISADKKEDGAYIPSSVRISFDNKELNKRLCKYLETKELLNTATGKISNQTVWNENKKKTWNESGKTIDEIKAISNRQ